MQETAALLREAAATRHELTQQAPKHKRSAGRGARLSGALASELAKAQREIEAQAVQARKANGEAGQLKQPRSMTGAQSLDPGAREDGTLAREAAAARQEPAASMAQHRQALDEEQTNGAETMNSARAA